MLDDLVQKIAAEADMSKEQILQKIEEKKDELSSMISDEGAAYIVAKELGVNILPQVIDLKIENIVPEMKSVELVGKITRMADVKAFKTEKAEGRLLTFWIADETASIRVVLWNDEIEKADGLQAGDVIRIKGFVRENRGQPEIRLGRFGKIAKSDKEIQDVQMFTRTIERGEIARLRDGDNKEVRAILLKVFDSHLFYETCPQCNKRLKKSEQGFSCDEHGATAPAYQMLLSGIIDDGTGSIRIVCFRDHAEHLVGMTAADAKALADAGEQKKIFANIPIGKELLIRGSVRNNQLFNRVEMIVNGVRDVDVKKEIEMLLEEVR
ncbi:MAG: DUF2240 family protein [Candidatus Aenigmarchaeota archaeon]|nr:DUF2240 family protein [Candidatus Aenigmarchaeota archaeon]